MVKEFFEDIKSDFEGTIIDLETIGEFDRGYDDSRQYRNVIPVIFGFITKDGIRIICAKNTDSIPKLKTNIIETLSSLERPFYAFNTNFERGVLFHNINKKIEFERELNLERYEKKMATIQSLKIPNYDDPFNDNGFLCSQSWLKREIDKAISHNRSCLLKERDILSKRGFREPDGLELIL